MVLYGLQEIQERGARCHIVVLDLYREVFYLCRTQAMQQETGPAPAPQSSMRRKTQSAVRVLLTFF